MNTNRKYNNNKNYNNRKTYDNNENKIEETENYGEFKDLISKEQLLRGIYKYGFKTPSKIQFKTINIIKEKKDLIAQSQSGTGKTGAFTLGVLERINEKASFPQALIVSHTKELVLQTKTVLEELSKYMEINIATCYGGESLEKNKNDCKKSNIILATPGRLNHLIRENAFDIKKIELIILDEVDQLLSNDFINQIKELITSLSKKCQICIYSATLTKNIIEITENFMTNPEKILINREKLNVNLIQQYYVDTESEFNKISVIEDLYGKFSISQSIIYVSSINKAIDLAKELKERNYTVGLIHSKLDPKDRLDEMKNFRNGITRVLISTDLTARGIDIQQVGIVINYDLPINFETYLHRIGRTGRYNKKGVAINLIGSKKEYLLLKDIEYYYKIKINEMPDIDVINAYLIS